MSEGILFPGDRSLPTEDIEIDISDEILIKLAVDSIEKDMTIQDLIIKILQNEIQKDQRKMFKNI